MVTPTDQKLAQAQQAIEAHLAEVRSHPLTSALEPTLTIAFTHRASPYRER